MKKSEFEIIKKEYYKRRKKLEELSIGELVWKDGLDGDIHPTIVMEINVDEDYIGILDLSYTPPREEEIPSCITAQEAIEKGYFSKEDVNKEYKKYEQIINEIKRGRR